MAKGLRSGWANHCLAHGTYDPIISQAGLRHTDSIHVLISTGTWTLPRPRHGLHHVVPYSISWLKNFVGPPFDLQTEDKILWGNLLLSKVKMWHIWDSIRLRFPEIPRYKWVWHKLKILRYAHQEWLLCLSHLPTLGRLTSSGITTLQHCYLCVVGLQTHNHLFTSCPYSHYILEKLSGMLRVPLVEGSWPVMLAS